MEIRRMQMLNCYIKRNIIMYIDVRWWISWNVEGFNKVPHSAKKLIKLIQRKNDPDYWCFLIKFCKIKYSIKKCNSSIYA